MLKLRLENNTNCINAPPEVETLLVTRANRAEVMKKASNWLMEVVNWGPARKAAAILHIISERLVVSPEFEK